MKDFRLCLNKINAGAVWLLPMSYQDPLRDWPVNTTQLSGKRIFFVAAIPKQNNVQGVCVCSLTDSPLSTQTHTYTVSPCDLSICCKFKTPALSPVLSLNLQLVSPLWI